MTAEFATLLLESDGFRSAEYGEMTFAWSNSVGFVLVPATGSTAWKGTMTGYLLRGNRLIRLDLQSSGNRPAGPTPSTLRWFISALTRAAVLSGR